MVTKSVLQEEAAFTKDKYFDSSDKFFDSPVWFGLLVLGCAIPYWFSQYAIAFGFCAVALAVALIFTRNTMPAFSAFMMCTLAVIEQYKITTEEIFGYAWVLIPVAPAFIFHIIRYMPLREKYRPSKTFLPQVAVTVMLMMGGAGSISAAMYFRLAPLYYVLFLGPVLLGMMTLMQSDIPKKGEYISKYLAKTMMAAALLLLLMWFACCLKEGFGIHLPHRQWKNNAGNFMLLATPLTVWYGIKKKWGVVFIGFATFQALSVAMSGSRGSTLMMAVVFPLSLIVYLINVKGWRRLVDMLPVIIAAVAMLAYFLPNGAENLLKYIEDFDINDSSGRDNLYAEGLKNFFEYPIFGTGLGYRNDVVYPLNDMAIFWYHSTPIQIIASMGIFGAMAYIYQFVVRMRIGLKNSAFHICTLLGFLGFEGYSCVNTGDFTPLPFAFFAVYVFLILEKCNDDAEFMKSEQKENILKGMER